MYKYVDIVKIHAHFLFKKNLYPRAFLQIHEHVLKGCEKVFKSTHNFKNSPKYKSMNISLFHQNF